MPTISRVVLALLCAATACQPPVTPSAGSPAVAAPDATRLPTGVRLDPVGRSFDVGALPLGIALSPGNTRAALLLNGWATQGVQIVDWRTGRVTQTLPQRAAFLGITFSPDGRWLYASGGYQDMIYRYHWAGDSAAIADSVPLYAAAAGHRAGSRYPAQIATSRDGRWLYVAENMADSLAVMELATGTVIQRVATGRYPYGVVVASDGTVYVSAWGDNTVSVFTASNNRLQPSGTLPAGRHPSALLLTSDGTRLFVASASTDHITVLDTRARRVVAELSDAPPDGPHEGSTPNALALTADGARLYVAEADANATAVFELASATANSATARGNDHLAYRMPNGWYPAAVALVGDTLLVANGKGSGTRPNPDGPQPTRAARRGPNGAANTTHGQLTGTLSVIPVGAHNDSDRAVLSARVATANGWGAPRRDSRFPPFEHVIYVIKENRTYDQMLGDLTTADGDTSLTYFPRPVTPNHHALAERFGTFDRFFVNAEVSADGHNWTTAAYATDYVEKTVQSNYSSRRSSYDYEGTNRGVIPDDDVNSPSTGYLWDLAQRKGITFRNYGEFVVADRAATTGAGAVPHFRATKPFLVDHTDPVYPGFDLDITDQHRADLWIAELQDQVRAGSMPALEIVRLPNDHTSGGSAGKPTPRADVADNDLALGRMIAALSTTPFWKSTVVFVLEDDAQNGPDHVDSHRSPLLVISPYSRSGAFHRFTNTTDVIRTIEGILSLSSLSQFDFFGRPLTDIWSSTPDLRPYVAETPAVSLMEKNGAAGRGARESAHLQLEEEDESDDDDFSQIIWHMVKGWDAPYPGVHRMSLLEARRGK